MRSCCVAQGAVWRSEMTRKDGMGEEREASEGGDVCVIMADLHCYVAETNTILQIFKNIYLFK